MNLDKYTALILKQLKEATDYWQIEAVIQASVNQIQDMEFETVVYFGALEKQIEGLSPLTLSSTQFSCFRYALIFLRSLSKEIKSKAF